MDSGNSGSFQSSSSGDNDDYDDPRNNSSSISSFMNIPTHPSSVAPTPPSLNSSSFDTLSPYFNFSSLQPDISTFDHTTIGNIAPTSLPTSSAAKTVMSSNPTATNMPNNTTRSSKKRSRASRRAPTTVLTTDTSNFRAMVQEFTGFPAPPFASSMIPRPRLDLFGGATATAPPFLLRPFSQKTPFFPMSASPSTSSSPSLIDVIASVTRTSNTSAVNGNISLASVGATSAAGNIQNPSFDLQSIFQAQNNQNTSAELSLPVLGLMKPHVTANLDCNPGKGIENFGTAQSSESINRAAAGLYGWIDRSVDHQASNSARKQNEDYGNPQQQQIEKRSSSSTGAATRVVDGRFNSWIISSDH